MLKRVLTGTVVALVLGLGIGATMKNNGSTSTEIVIQKTSHNSDITTDISDNVANAVSSDDQPNATILVPKQEQLIIFNTIVASETVEAAMQRLEELKSKGYKQAYLILDSPGGSVFDGARLIAWMKHSPLKVNTICDGLCASMAAHLFEVGDKRYMTDKSTLMFHPASGGVMGTLEQMVSRLTFVKTYVDRLDESIANRAGMDYAEFKSRTLTEFWVETQDAVDLNLADNTVFVSYNRSSNKSFNMEEHLKRINKVIPEEYKKTTVFRLETIKLPDAKAEKTESAE